jgi:hypothetical protein
MNLDNALMFVILFGIALCCEYFRAELVRWHGLNRPD